MTCMRALKEWRPISMQNPCEICKRTKCPDVCFPEIDYERAMRKRYGKKTRGAVPELRDAATGMSRPMRKVHNMEDGR